MGMIEVTVPEIVVKRVAAGLQHRVFVPMPGLLRGYDSVTLRAGRSRVAVKVLRDQQMLLQSRSMTLGATLYWDNDSPAEDVAREHGCRTVALLRNLLTTCAPLPVTGQLVWIEKL